MTAFRRTDEYRRGSAAQIEVANLFQSAGFPIFEYDSSSMKSPGYEGEGVWITAPDLVSSRGFYVEVKAKGRATWTWKLGKRYEHGWPKHQDDAYRELPRTSGQRLAMAIREAHAPTEGPRNLLGQWPMYLIQWIDRLGLPRDALLENKPPVFYPRDRFEPLHIFIKRLRETNASHVQLPPQGKLL